MILAYAQLAAAMALVGANVAILKALAESLPVAIILGLRCALATLVLLPFVIRPNLPLSNLLPTPHAGLNLALQAAAGTIGYNALLIAGVRRTGALEAGLVLAALPAVVGLGAWLLLREPLLPRRAAALLLAAFGMAALAFARGGDAHRALLGDALVLAAVVAEAAYVLLAKFNAARVSPLAGAFWMQVLSATFMAPFAILAWDAARFTPSLSALLAVHGLTASVLAVVLWYAGLRRVPGAVAGVFAGLLPLSAGVVSIAVLGETPTMAHGAGAVLMLISVALATWPGHAPAATP